MDNNASQIWELTSAVLENTLSRASYNGFIEELQPIALQNNTLILLTPKLESRVNLENRYTHTVESAIREATGRDYGVRFIVPSERSEFEAVPAGSNAITLNPKYTFDTFVIGSSNRFAHAAAQNVANNPGRSYNPLFIYGGVGLGKTHLMHAIGNFISLARPSANIMYVTSEKFTIELIAAIRNDKNEDFRARYRNVDVLMVDDIQFISNKEGIQEEFFHTFNALYDAQKQIVISSDKPPKDIPDLEERLRSRFEWGLIADIQPPNYETRVAILQNKAINDNLSVPQEVLHFIASRVESNIRELEGSLTRVMALSSLTGQPVTEALAAEALKDFYPNVKARTVDVDLIKQVVAERYKISIEDFSSKRRNREVAFPRQIAMYLVRDILGMSLPRIGEAFGGRDHTTVMHGIDKISADIQKDPETKTVIEDLKKRIKE